MIFPQIAQGKKPCSWNSIDTMPSNLCFPKMKAEQLPCYWARRKKNLQHIHKDSLRRGRAGVGDLLTCPKNGPFWDRRLISRLVGGERQRHIPGSYNMHCTGHSFCAPWQRLFGWHPQVPGSHSIKSKLMHTHARTPKLLWTKNFPEPLQDASAQRKQN